MVSDKAIRQALYQKLNTASVTSLLAEGSASLHHYTAKKGSLYPFIIFHKQTGTPVRRMGGNAFDDHLWLVKAVAGPDANSTVPSSSAAEDIAKAFDDLLDFGTLTVTGGTTLFLARDSDIDYVETTDDKQYRHHGALYRLRLEAT
jgi:hypothetical protein